MTKRLLVEILCIFLAACSGIAPTATMTPTATDTTPTFTETPSQTPTPESTSTPTETVTPEYTSEIVPVYTETIDVEIRGVDMHVQIITDKTVTESVTPKINKIFLSPHFVNSYGENSSEAIADLVAHAVFRAWLRNGTYDEVVARKDITFNTYMEMVAECQAGNRDWADVEYKAVANDLTTPEYDLAKRTFRPGELVTLVFVDSNNKDLISNMTEDVGLETNFTNLDLGTQMRPDGGLEIWIGAIDAYISVNWGEVQMALLLRGLLRISWYSQDRKLPYSDLQEFQRPFSAPFSDIVFVRAPTGDCYSPIMVDPTPPEEVNQP
jgi:hypothetical protein